MSSTKLVIVIVVEWIFYDFNFTLLTTEDSKCRGRFQLVMQIKSSGSVYTVELSASKKWFVR